MTITAQFDGAARQFEIKRENVPFLEHSLGRSLYAVLRDFTEGRWTFVDTAAVISFALHGPSRDDKLAINLARQAARCGMPAEYASRYKPHPNVVAVLEREGHGNFAPLAADILTEAVFGVSTAPEAVNDAD